jgi:L-gulono-1,4-lactone dehydrogenase
VEWRNWSGLAVARPTRVQAPASPEQVADAVQDAARDGLRVRMRGTGHSFTDVAVTDGLLLEPHRLTGVVAVDRRAMTVTALAGTTLHELNARLEALGLALHNLGDVDPQTLAGAVSTGTHGTGGVTASLSGQLEALQLVTAKGELRTVSRECDPDLFHAARVGLGAVGILTALTFRVEPAFTLHAVERPVRWEELLERHGSLVEEHHHVDAYWFPHTDRCLVKTNDRTLDEPQPLSRMRAYVEDELLSNTAFGVVDRITTRWPRTAPRVNRLTSRGWGPREYTDLSHRVFVASRRVVFREMEYSLPREHGMAALREVRRLMQAERWNVAWPVEIRATPPDEAWLSSTYGRDSVYLAFHVGGGADHRPYFTGVERLLREYGGRPHWGKLHTRTAADLAPAYPRWADFAAVRDRVDPERLFANDYLERVLG